MRTAPLALAAVLLLTGCGTDPAPEPVPVPSASAAPSPTVAGAALPTPRSTGGVERRVEEAVLAYFAGLNRLFATGDRSAFDATYTDACGACRTFADKVAGDAAKGLRTDAHDEVLSLRVAGAVSPNAGAATVTFRVPAYRITDASGKEVGSYPASTVTRIFSTVRTPQGFRVVAIQDPSR